MWAMMPIFRILSSGVVRGIAFLYSAKTRGDQDAPLVVRGPVSLRRHREAFGLLDAGSLNAGSRSCLFRAHAPALARAAHFHPEYAKALLASAIRCVSSFFLIVSPSPFEARISSAASRSAIVFSLRARLYRISQRMASAVRRSGRTSTGT